MASRIWTIYSITCLLALLYIVVWVCIAIFQHRLLHNKEILKCDITETRLGHKTSNISMTQNDQVTPGKKELPQDALFPPTMLGGTNINPEIVKFFTIGQNETKDKYVNLHHYEFRLNSRKCSGSDMFLIMIVHSAPHNYKKRSQVRTTYGSVHSYRGKRLAVVFMLGAVQRTAIQDSLNREAKQYGDIVQGNFNDTYKNLIQKHVMAMHWFKFHCSADFILKLDDDTFVNPFRTVDYILNTKLVGLTIHCKVVPRHGPIRNPRSKWYTPESQYPFSILPHFCPGFAYITTPQTWTALYEASKISRSIDMDDVYVSAVLAMEAQVHQISMDSIFYACPRNITLFNIDRLSDKGIFLDRFDRCGGKPFSVWNKVQAKFTN